MPSDPDRSKRYLDAAGQPLISPWMWGEVDGVHVQLDGREYIVGGNPESDLHWAESALAALWSQHPSLNEERVLDALQEYSGELFDQLARTHAEVFAQEMLPGRTAEQLLNEVPEETDWIVPGFLVRGWATKFAGREKVGKGTFAFYLLGRIERGEDTVFGPSTETTALILTEEPMESVREKVEAFGLRRARIVYGYELTREAPTWPEKVAKIVEWAIRAECGIVFVDNVSRSAGIEDEAGTDLGRAVEYLQEMCRMMGIALMVDHHHRKAGGAIEDKSRGGTALAGAMDINVDIERIGKRGVSNKRRISAAGRLRETNWIRAVEANEGVTDYDLIEDAGEVDDDDRLMVAAITFDALAKQGPVTAADFQSQVGVKSDRTARRWLGKLVDAGLAEQLPGERAPDGRLGAARWVKPGTAATPDGLPGVSGVSGAISSPQEALQTALDTPAITSDTPPRPGLAQPESF